MQYQVACWVCHKSFAQPSMLKKHMRKEGHDGAFNESHKMKWVYLMNWLLQYISVSLELPGTSALLSFVWQDDTLWTRLDKKLDDSDLEMLSHFEKVNSMSVDAEHEYNPPNAVASLTHWKVLLNLINWLTRTQLEGIKFINKGFLPRGVSLWREVGRGSHWSWCTFSSRHVSEVV